MKLTDKEVIELFEAAVHAHPDYDAEVDGIECPEDITPIILAFAKALEAKTLDVDMEDVESCGEISCHDCDDRYMAALTEISRLRKLLAVDVDKVLA